MNSDSVCLEITVGWNEAIENLTATAEHRSRNFDNFIGQVRQTLLQHVQDGRGVLSDIHKLVPPVRMQDHI